LDVWNGLAGRVVSIFLLTTSLPAGSAAQEPTSAAPQRPPLVQPGAPGEAPRPITVTEATDSSHVQFRPADVAFMQGMIGHHAQAIEMTDLVNVKSTDEDIRKLAQRIAASQDDEIQMMREWLEGRGQQVPDEHAHHMPGAALMPGMLTSDEMTRLRAATSPQLDRLFLEYMIKHHDGALIMVAELFATPGAGQESEIFAFASDVDGDQRMEMARMAAMLKERQE